MPQNERVILFVCTGNTCRSPMAEVIARDLLKDDSSTTVLSAGIAARDGHPATVQAERAVARLGLDLSNHKSQQLTKSLIERATAIYVMTVSHELAVLELDQSAQDKLSLLNPEGSVPDPFGMPDEVYEETAAVLRELISGRLKEIEV